jgi:hypothetical protein
MPTKTTAVGLILVFGQSLFGEQLRLFERADAEQIARLGSFVGLEGSAFRVPLGHRWKLLLRRIILQAQALRGNEPAAPIFRGRFQGPIGL